MEEPEVREGLHEFERVNRTGGGDKKNFCYDVVVYIALSD